ncbi:ABC transporter substrate-binding protein [Halolamina salifodinae]|uniref:Peptide/nickel transport system substrate-binding protein n=1 Tax=Halolamina salifodinae TaxID=1202767 RepID=A0A8T4GYD4_9EURY|nr:ABC transporter substrate-binding protein [Halolamina salifodinae]MBP1986574.1 peptide/nickel transport system substrate-binding protein [Halolamina salifodinae]
MKSLGITGVAGLAGCMGGNGTETEEEAARPGGTTTPADPENVQEGGELIASFGADVAQFDPAKAADTTSTKAFGLTYESLLSVGFDGSINNELAHTFEEVDDTTFRAELREGVMFHNGEELTAEDVQVSYERYEGKTNAADVYDWYESSEIIDDYTIEFSLKNPYAPLRFNIAGIPVIPAEVENGDLDITENPIGTGPYEFVEHQPDELFRIERNVDYWFEGDDSVPATPPIETVTYRIIVEQSAQQASLESGDIHISNAPPAASISDFAENEDFTVNRRLAGGYDLMSYPLEVEPFTNQKVRRGISRLVPRDDIVESVYEGLGVPAYMAISQISAVYDTEEWNELNDRLAEEYLGYDQEQADTLLEEGFNEAGVEPPFETSIITNENPQRVQWVQLIAESLNNTDYFDVSVEQFEWNTYVGKITSEATASTNEIIAVGWSGGWDPDAYINELVNSGNWTPNGFNFSHYENAEVDSLLQEGASTYELEQRAEIYTNLVEILAEEAPMTYIRFGEETDVYDNTAVTGFRTYPINGDEFKGIYSPADGGFTYLNQE